ncbi:MAG: hypothetical protein ACI39G_05960 [Pseudoramibacter sp.]
MKKRSTTNFETEEERKAYIDGLRYFDDIFFTEALSGNQTACAKCILDPILDSDVTVREVHVQDIEKHIGRSGIRLDAKVVDARNNIYDLEVQRSVEGADPRRARMNVGLVSQYSKKDADYKHYPDVYVIFITETDPLKSGRAKSHFVYKEVDVNEPLNDGSHIIYVNAENIDNTTTLGKLMHDFKSSQPEAMYNAVLAERMKKVKTDPMEVENMVHFYDERIQQRMQQKCDKVRQDTIVEDIINMFDFGVPENKIAEKYSIDQINQAKKLMKQTI